MTMTDHETQVLDHLNLSWPQSVEYVSEDSRPAASNFDGNREAESTDTSCQKPVTTYNGVPRELLRRARNLVGNEIRVLILEPGARGDPLVGTLRKVCLSDPIVYEPLSYTWKDYDTIENPDESYDNNVRPAIFLSNVEVFMDIGTNCEKALCRVRKSTTQRTLWVDAICVNQDDPEERSRQVNLMQQIFARAFTVLVYLGEESTEHDSGTAMSLLGQPDRLQESNQLDQREATSLKHLFERPYFRRMWIVQEVALAPTLELYCGPHKALVSAFAGKPLEAILGSRVTHPPWLKHSKQTLRPSETSYGKAQAEHVLNLILDTALCHCKDDRDRIFALFSLLNASSDKRLSADYNLSTRQVYTGIAAYLATNGFVWGVFTIAACLASNSDSGLPSWVPNWNMLSDVELQDEDVFRPIVPWSRNLRELPNDIVCCVTGSGIISVRGIHLGSVTHSNWVQSHSNRMKSVWTLTGLSENTPQDLWGCDLEFMAYKQPSNTQHVAALLPDLETVLILRVDGGFSERYTLVEIGTPLTSVALPEEWAVNDRTLIRLSFKRFSSSERRNNHMSTIFSSQELFPRLRDHPELWALNPSTATMTLTYKAIEQTRSVDLRELSLWKEWQEYAIPGFRILREKKLIRLLIDHVDNLAWEDYEQLEMRAGLDPPRSLECFLYLFITEERPTACPDKKAHGDQVADAKEALSHLMKWAEVFYRFLSQLQSNNDVPLLKLPMGQEFYSKCMVVTNFQYPAAPGSINRVSYLLQTIFDQTPEAHGPEDEPRRRRRPQDQRYWDWTNFESIVEQRSSILKHIQPDVEKLQAVFGGSDDLEPDFEYAVGHQVLAAHGVDLNQDKFSEIQIR